MARDAFTTGGKGSQSISGGCEPAGDSPFIYKSARGPLALTRAV